jgi:hypothetical protein
MVYDVGTTAICGGNNNNNNIITCCSDRVRGPFLLKGKGGHISDIKSTIPDSSLLVLLSSGTVTYPYPVSHKYAGQFEMVA